MNRQTYIHPDSSAIITFHEDSFAYQTIRGISVLDFQKDFLLVIWKEMLLKPVLMNTAEVWLNQLEHILQKKSIIHLVKRISP